jgi:hypothetical protein
MCTCDGIPTYLRWTAPHVSASRRHNSPFPDPGPPTTNTIRAGAFPNMRSAALRKQSRWRRPSPFESTSSSKDFSVSSSGRSPTDSSNRRILLRLRYGPASPPPPPPSKSFAASLDDDVLANCRNRSDSADISHSPKATDPAR